MVEALRCGIGVTEFWELTPRETWQAIEAAIWRDRREQERETRLAWLTATLSRAKKIPSLKRLMTEKKQAQRLIPAQAEKRREEYQQMVKAVDFNKLNQQVMEAIRGYHDRARTGADPDPGDAG